jgi:hypothetical protein
MEQRLKANSFTVDLCIQYIKVSCPKSTDILQEMGHCLFNQSATSQKESCSRSTEKDLNQP